LYYFRKERRDVHFSFLSIQPMRNECFYFLLSISIFGRGCGRPSYFYLAGRTCSLSRALILLDGHGSVVGYGPAR
jgi:hypothetical protein